MKHSLKTQHNTRNKYQITLFFWFISYLMALTDQFDVVMHVFSFLKAIDLCQLRLVDSNTRSVLDNHRAWSLTLLMMHKALASHFITKHLYNNDAFASENMRMIAYTIFYQKMNVIRFAGEHAAQYEIDAVQTWDEEWHVTYRSYQEKTGYDVFFEKKVLFLTNCIKKRFRQ